MHPSFTVLGVAVILLVVVEMLVTAVHQGSGRFTRLFSNQLWRMARRVLRPTGRHFHRLLSLTGVAILMLLTASYLLVLWAGWFLVFCGAPEAVVRATDGASAGILDRVYFAGMAVFTLGTGDFVAGAPAWRIVMAIAALTGLFFVTATITYLVPAVAAAGRTRQLAIQLYALGRTPTDIVRRFWDGEGLPGLEAAMLPLIPDLARMLEQSVTYPIVHFLHARRRREAISIRLAVLDETVSLLTCGLAPRARLPRETLGMMDTIIGTFLDTLDAVAILPAAAAPPPPSLTPIRELGLPTVDVAAWEQIMQRRDHRRRMLLAFVERDGWRWADVYSLEGD